MKKNQETKKAVKENKSLVAAEAAEVQVQEVPEVKAEVQEVKAPEVKETKAPEISESDKTTMIVESLISRNKDLKIVSSDSKTGVSFFSGKKRLCKVLKNKRGVTVEINVSLPQGLKDLPGMETISISTAYKKHLGTMKHLYRASDSKQISLIIKEALEIFKSDLAASKKQEESKEAKAV